jgi:hypothetical protein
MPNSSLRSMLGALIAVITLAAAILFRLPGAVAGPDYRVSWGKGKANRPAGRSR